MPKVSISHQHMVYIVTYSRADTTKFSVRKSFADAVVEAWRASGLAIEHWVVSLEAHLNEDIESINKEMNLYHYHMALKLTFR